MKTLKERVIQLIKNNRLMSGDYFYCDGYNQALRDTLELISMEPVELKEDLNDSVREIGRIASKGIDMCNGSLELSSDPKVILVEEGSIDETNARALGKLGFNIIFTKDLTKITRLG